MNPQKKYILKPGKHQFAPGSPAVHDNDSLTDAEAEWYLDKYPHIKSLFTIKKKPVRSQTKSVKSKQQNNNEDIPATN